MTTMVYVIVQYDEYWDGKKILEVHDNIQHARIKKQNYYKSLWERIEIDNDPRLKKIWYEIEQVLFIQNN